MFRQLVLPLLCILTFLPNSYANNLEVSFSADTVHACINEPFEIFPTVAGGTAPYQYSWNTGDTDSTLVIVPTQSFRSYTLTVTDADNHRDSAILVVHALDECVYPGDANGDGTANNLDVLSLGLAYGHSGYIRPNAHLDWIGQPSHSWPGAFTNGVNFAHSDGDGNGVVDENDLIAISHNYLTPNLLSTSPSTSNGIPLSVQFDALNALPGDTVRAKIMIGNPGQPADSIYGLAFALELEGYEIDSGSVKVNYQQSVLGSPTELLSLDKTFYDTKRIEVGISRNNGQTVSAYGQAAEIIVVIDEIIGKKAGVEILDFKLENISIYNGRGESLQVNPVNSALSIFTSNSNDLPASLLTLAYLPDMGWKICLGNFPEPGNKLELLDIQGKILRTYQIKGKEIFISKAGLPEGIFLLRYQGKEGFSTLKILN